MAKKLSAEERAKIRLGDFDYSPEMLRDMTRRIEEEDKKENLPRASATPERSTKQPPTPKAQRGRPRKHETGRQISVWLEDDDLLALRLYAAARGASVSELASEIINEAIKKNPG